MGESWNPFGERMGSKMDSRAPPLYQPGCTCNGNNHLGLWMVWVPGGG